MEVDSCSQTQNGNCSRTKEKFHYWLPVIIAWISKKIEESAEWQAHPLARYDLLAYPWNNPSAHVAMTPGPITRVTVRPRSILNLVRQRTQDSKKEGFIGRKA